MPKEIKFGTDGWRAVIGKDFNLENVEAVAQAIADYLSRKAKVVVGYDTRELSRESAECISEVLTANGINVILSRAPLPTQAISYSTRALKCDAGIMVTASHNPADFNGIKIKGPFGGSAGGEITGRIERLTFKHKAVKLSLLQAKKKKLLKVTDLTGGYLKFLRSYLDMPLLKQGRLNVLVDSMHGTGDYCVARVLEDTPCRVKTIHGEYDSAFGGVKPEPILPSLKETVSIMKQGRFDIALVNDGDADRIAVLDAKGKFISPQQVISLLLLHLLRYRKMKGAVVRNIAGTSLLSRIAEKYKLKLYDTPVGFKHISLLMQKKDILIGGEEAGGIGFKNYIPERDGILAGLLLLEMMIARKKAIADLLEDMQDEFGRYVYLRKDITCRPQEKPKVTALLARMRGKKTFAGLTINRIDDYDGLKFYLSGKGWILFRLSGTEPILRIYAEAGTKTEAKRLIDEGVKGLG